MHSETDVESVSDVNIIKVKIKCSDSVKIVKELKAKIILITEFYEYGDCRDGTESDI